MGGRVFRETELSRLQVGSAATMHLMGYAAPLHGIVQHVTRGINTVQVALSTQGLPNIDPVYRWVRLAQRIPMRIRITASPSLVARLTCTVSVEEPAEEGGGWVSRLRQQFRIRNIPGVSGIA